MASGNSIYRVLVHAVDGLWAYDDENFNVREQPLVFGVDLVLEKMVEKVEGIGDRLNLVFSCIPFPGSEHCLKFVREETEGFVYLWEEKNLQGWLSPSLRNYFPVPPPKIFLQLLPIG